jgi:hypothetical protein
MQRSSIVGDPIPFRSPNGTNDKAIEEVVNKGDVIDSNWYCAGLCCLTGFGCLYAVSKQLLVEQDSYGFCDNNGHFQFLPPGRHVRNTTVDVTEDRVHEDTVPIPLPPRIAFAGPHVASEQLPRDAQEGRRRHPRRPHLDHPH